MRAFVRAGQIEHALDRPLCMTLTSVAELLGGRPRATFDRIARLDRERTPGEHAFERIELLELVAAAHSLLADPPDKLRRVRRVLTGPLPAADGIGRLVAWLRERSDATVTYELWRSTVDPPGD
jgi:hypothetical protein